MGDIFDSRHYRILKYSLQSIGHWPFQSSKEKLFFRSLTLFIISTIVIPKVPFLFLFWFVTNLESCYSIALLIIVGVNMLLIVFAGVTVVIKISSLDEMIRIIFISLAALSHLFWISWLGHILIVKSEKVFISTYQSEWYRLPPRLQLMIIPIMMRSLKPCEITAGKIYVMSMQSFGTALKTMMSFFTVLNSMR
ncbi:odorant receptor 13a-like [Fopius arisanus]|uniref:Odorant receptor 13a-like n=1 Tax=Fopius arisanus TaxID=64838 RepID=A0A9R1TGJ4_9HYME|nr:PREDICTED: odorant receptor 13a-like [Fopius arisanus]